MLFFYSKTYNSLGEKMLNQISNYIQNKETLDVTGGEIKVTYNDDSTDTIPMTGLTITPSAATQINKGYSKT